VLDAWMWARKPKTEPDVKESVRWVEGYHMVADLAAILPDTRLVYIADREGDLRALMDAAAERGHPADWLVRSKHNTLERLECALVIYLIIAWRILHLVTWGRDCPNLPCEVVFDPAEWQAAWIVAYHTKPPETPPPWVKWCD